MQRKMQRSLTLLLLCLLSASPSSTSAAAAVSPKVGVCYGQLGDNLPPPSETVRLIKSLGAKRVKIYDATATPNILPSLRDTDIQVSLMVPNQLIPSIASSQSVSNRWVKTNVVPFFPRTKIRYILVGNEILSQPDNVIWHNLVPAMRRITISVKKFNLRKVKVGTPSAMDVLESSFPPSNGTFRSDVSASVIKPMLSFLNRTKSFFFVDVFTFYPWSADPVNINLDYALLSSKNITYDDPVSGLTYTNLLDQMLDALHYAMKRLGYPNIRLFIAETGWPNGGDIDQIGGNIYNAATYNRNVVKKLTARPPVGTPARPGAMLTGFIFGLFNENQKEGRGTERNFGLLYPNGSNVYEIDLKGEIPESKFKPLPKATNNEPYKGKIWCVAAPGADFLDLMEMALVPACEQGDCDPIRPGGVCFDQPLVGHASYALSAYWAQFQKSGGICYFHGLATETTEDPSYGNCTFPSVTL